MLPIVLLASLFAAASTDNTYTPTLPLGGVIAWIICNGRKRQQIGGWLLYYYWQLYSGVLMTVVFVAMGFQSYVPESYDDPQKYHLFLASALPSIVILSLEFAVATVLISVRSWDLLKLLRWVIIAGLVAGSIATVIDINYFPESLVFDFLNIPAALWLAYFFKSRRVKHVFKSHDWEVAVQSIYPANPGVAT